VFQQGPISLRPAAPSPSTVTLVPVSNEPSEDSLTRSEPAQTAAELAAKAERRRRGMQVSTICLHSMSWVLLAFYATDYLPPLSIRLTVGLTASRATQYLVGYLALGTICLVLGVAFGSFYQERIARSRYSWRWFFFPGAAALLLIPAQGESELLTRLVEAVFLLGGLALGRLVPKPVRRSRRPVSADRGAES